MVINLSLPTACQSPPRSPLLPLSPPAQGNTGPPLASPSLAPPSQPIRPPRFLGSRLIVAWPFATTWRRLTPRAAPGWTWWGYLHHVRPLQGAADGPLQAVCQTGAWIRQPGLDPRPLMDPDLSRTHVTSLQRTQNSALRIATGCVRSTPTPHLHAVSHVLPLREHTDMRGLQFFCASQAEEHPCNHLHHPVQTRRSLRGTPLQPTSQPFRRPVPECLDSPAQCFQVPGPGSQ